MNTNYTAIALILQKAYESKSGIIIRLKNGKTHRANIYSRPEGGIWHFVSLETVHGVAVAGTEIPVEIKDIQTAELIL